MLRTPYYCIDLGRIARNMERIARLEALSGAKSLLALKCFATWSAFPAMRAAMAGTTSSSLYELRLGREKFGGETHAYSVAWADHEMAEVATLADKVIFNSLSQLDRFGPMVAGLPQGLRVNPGISSSGFDLADPARPFSRLGEHDPEVVARALGRISGFMFHNNCENADFDLFDRMLGQIEARFGHLIAQMDWISLGGGIHFTGEGYPLERLAARLGRFAADHGVQVYLEPGEAAITQAATLEVTVLDTLWNGRNIAIVDASTEAHMLDLLIYRQSARIEGPTGPHEWMICGKSCLAGDVFGTFQLPAPLRPGDRISFADAAGYTMVKKNWFNGLNMPAIVLLEADGQERVVRAFDYRDYAASLS